MILFATQHRIQSSDRHLRLPTTLCRCCKPSVHLLLICEKLQHCCLNWCLTKSKLTKKLKSKFVCQEQFFFLFYRASCLQICLSHSESATNSLQTYLKQLNCLHSLFINDLPASLPSSVSCSLYADDLAIWSSSSSVPTAMEATQGALFRLERWSEYWCLPLNPSKCEASFFLVDPHQANLQPNLLLLGSHLRFNPTPTFLGVTFDRTLPFSKHVFLLRAKFFPRLKALHCISASSWGPSKESLSLLYKSFLWPLLALYPDSFLS